MTEVLLEKVYKQGKYLGKIVVDVKELTPAFLEKCRKDKDDLMGWKKYRKTMKEAGFDIDIRGTDSEGR